MPLDGHSYLVAQGWSGKGTGLRQGAISRPIAIPQKRTLAGLGKDRDEAFPFWDHLFAAAANSIQIKITKDEDDSDTSESEAAAPLKRTETGILSNKRPVTGLSAAASSGSTTPAEASFTPGSRQSLLTSAKRDAAKRGLYARFFRGPTLGPDEGKYEETEGPMASGSRLPLSTPVGAIMEEVTSVVENEKEKEKKREDGEKAERRRLRKEAKLAEKEKEKAASVKVVETKEERAARRDARRAAKAAKNLLKGEESNEREKKSKKEPRLEKKKRKRDKEASNTIDSPTTTTDATAEPPTKRKRSKKE